MLLRDHPLMSHRGLPSWPPVWSYCGGADDNHPHGEVGILKNVFISSVKSPTRCLLIMEHVAAEYIGDLLISDTAFCSEIYKVLLRHCGQTIQETGDIKLSDMRQVSLLRVHPPSNRLLFLVKR